MDRKENMYYVGVGASAGGLEALKEFFSNMPDNTGMSFIIVQHLSPDYKSLMDELLSRHTNMNIHIIEDGMKVEANNIYLIPPKKNLSIFHGKLYLEDKKNINILNLPIDIFFRSLAVDQGKNAVGIVLSGTGSDGTSGIKAIKEAGGMIMVQDEATAKFDGMPKNAVATGMVDYIISPKEMGKELLSYIEHPLEKKAIKKSKEDDHHQINILTKITMILRDFTGIDFSYYKENTIVRRIERRVKVKRFNTIKDYVELLKDSDKEKEILYRELLIGVTEFFRDKEAFDELKTNVIPNLDYNKKLIRIWSSGCSTGEEVYSTAILINEYIKDNNLECEVKIFGTDIDRYALDIASKGYYPDSIVSDVDHKYLSKYFRRKENGYVITENIRNMVVFAKHNVLKDPPFSKLDLLICRNLFIYIKPEMQQNILTMFYYSLNEKGYLMLGSSESLGDTKDAFETVSIKNKIYKYKPGYRTQLSDKIEVQRTRVEKNGSNGNIGFLYKPVKFEKMIIEVLNKVLPPSVIIDRNENIIQVINDTSNFLTFNPGKFSSNIFANISKDISLYLNNIVRKLKKGEDNIVFKNITGIKNIENKTVSIEGKIIEISDEKYYLISFFTDEKVKSREIRSNLERREEDKDQIEYLENELQSSQETLQATVEELETSNEELQSSNEELIASNEELQSTNEELQSVNEELFTVNNEYQSKIEELVDLNNDLDNLIKNTEIGALYLDRKLCIRRITPVVSKITNIIESDIGRPISHISTSNYYPELLEDINKVIESLQSIEKEIKDDKGNIWLARVRPFRTEFNSVEGVIITFVDVTTILK